MQIIFKLKHKQHGKMKFRTIGDEYEICYGDRIFEDGRASP